MTPADSSIANTQKSSRKGMTRRVWLLQSSNVSHRRFHRRQIKRADLTVR